MAEKNAELDEQVLDADSSAETDDAEEVVVSDSRARRKRKRGEAFRKTSVTETGKKGRPTPSRRQARRAVARTPADWPVIGGVVAYLQGVYAEMQKVTWPNQEETINLTQVVLAVTIAFAIGLGLIDTFYTWWFRQAFAQEIALFLGIGAGFLVILLGVVYYVFIYSRRSTSLPY